MRLWVVAVMLALAAPVDAGPKPGRIVRIERKRTGARGTPRVCQLNTGDNSLSCFGQPPSVGEIANVVGNDGILGAVRVTKVEPQNPSSTYGTNCSDGLWRADTEVVEGLNNPGGVPYGAWAIVDVTMQPSAKLTDPPQQLPAGASGESAALTLDRDGEPPGDFMVTWYPCNAANPGGNTQTYCVDFWFANGASGWSKSRQDMVTWCM